MSRIYSLAVLGVAISAAWCVRIVSEVESAPPALKVKRHRRKLELIHIDVPTTIFEYDSPANRGIGQLFGSKTEKSTKKTGRSAEFRDPTTRGIGYVGGSKAGKYGSKASKGEKSGYSAGSKSGKSGKHITGGAYDDKSGKDTKFTKPRAVPSVQQVNEKVKKEEEALMQMVLSSENALSMSMQNELDTMDGTIPGAVEEVDTDSPSGAPSDILSIIEPTLSPTIAEPPVQVIINSVEGTDNGTSGAEYRTAPLLYTLSQLVAVTVILIAVSFD